MTTPTDPESRARMLGVSIVENWDYDTARAHSVQQITLLRREHPAAFRRARATAFDLRAELGEDLPGIPSELVEKVTITLLAKVLGLAIGQGADPAPVMTAGAIATLAVLNEFWTKSPKGRPSSGPSAVSPPEVIPHSSSAMYQPDIDD